MSAGALVSQRCAVRGCKDYCRPSQLMCIGHWRMVPTAVQRKVYSRHGRIRRAGFAEARQIVENTLAQYEDRSPASSRPNRRLTPVVPSYCTNCGMSADRCGCADSDFSSEEIETEVSHATATV